MDIKVNLDLSKYVKALAVGGPVQRWVDNEVIKLNAPYTPFLSGGLVGSATRGTVIGSGEVRYIEPYARFQYYGKVMVDPNTGSTWAPRHGTKVVTAQNLKYRGAPKRGAFWFDRMIADHKQDIINGATKELGKVTR